jgi:hypothetical protein
LHVIVQKLRRSEHGGRDGLGLELNSAILFDPVILRSHDAPALNMPYR